MLLVSFMRVICVVFSVDTRISSTVATPCSTGMILYCCQFEIHVDYCSKQLLSMSSQPVFHLPVQVKLQLNDQTVR